MVTIAEQYMIPDIPEMEIQKITLGKYIKHLGEICKPNFDSSVLVKRDEIPVFGGTIDGIIMFIDIGSFTERSGNLTPAQTAYWVNRFFKQVWPICKNNKATLDKLIGDCLMLILSDNLGCNSALQSSCEIAKQCLSLDTHGYYPHIGITKGKFWLGYTGPPDLMTLSVFGDSVNLASRLASAAQSNSFAVSKNLWDSLESKSEFKTEFKKLKGRKKILKDFKDHKYYVIKRKSVWIPQGHLKSLLTD